MRYTQIEGPQMKRVEDSRCLFRKEGDRCRESVREGPLTVKLVHQSIGSINIS